jgi:two-component system, chemotaxis family, chemotaxis protein CheY
MLSVLHADGDRHLQDTHADFLASRGFQVHKAEGGVDCVQKLRQLAPNFLILDHELPWGGGAGVLAVMREEPRLRRIPVVVTSAVSSVATLNKLALPPVVGTFAKSFRLTELLEAIVGLRMSADVTSDSENLIMDLEQEIQLRTSRRVQDLRVECVDGALSVHGQVQSYHAKQLILVAAMNYLAGRGIEVAFNVEVK